MILAPQKDQPVFFDCPDHANHGRTGIITETLGMLATVKWDDNGQSSNINGGYLSLFYSKALLLEAAQHIVNLVDGQYCTWGSSRHSEETCREFRSRMQGVPNPGCFHCEARDFLKKIEVELPRNR